MHHHIMNFELCLSQQSVKLLIVIIDKAYQRCHRPSIIVEYTIINSNVTNILFHNYNLPILFLKLYFRHNHFMLS